MAETTIDVAATDKLPRNVANPDSRPARAIHPFTILDTMMLLLAIAIGLAACRAILGSDGPQKGSWTNINLLSFMAGPLTAFVVVRRLLSLPSSLRGLTRQAGTMMCLIAIIFILVKAAYWCVIWETTGLRFEWYSRLASESSSVGAAVLVAWLTLVLGGRWRSARCWLDQLGRILGAYWIFTLLFVSWYETRVWAIARIPYLQPDTDSLVQPPQMLDAFPQPPDEVFSVAGKRSFSEFLPAVPAGGIPETPPAGNSFTPQTDAGPGVPRFDELP